MLSVAASVGGSFYVAGGTSLAPDASGKPVRDLPERRLSIYAGQGLETGGRHAQPGSRSTHPGACR